MLMRSTFSRTFCSIVAMLLVAFLAIGTSFTLLVKNYLTNRVVADLKTDGEVIAQLVQSAYTEDHFSGRDFRKVYNVIDDGQ